MTLVLRSEEGHVVTLARLAVGATTGHEAAELLLRPMLAPEKLGPSARRALSDTLAKGVVLALARYGGWWAIGGRRLWERAAVPQLHFTGNVVTLLQWLLVTSLKSDTAGPLVFSHPVTPAEDVLVTLLATQLQHLGCARLLLTQTAIRSLPLVRLAHAAALAEHGELGEALPFSVNQLGVFVEGLRHLLVERWVAAQRAQLQLATPEPLLRIGRAQGAVLDAWLAAIDVAGRRDLATFLIEAARQWVSEPLRVSPAQWPRAPVGLRTEAIRASVAWLRPLSRLHEWDRTHRSIRFIDDGYAQAQQLIVEWARLGEAGFEAVSRHTSACDALFFDDSK